MAASFGLARPPWALAWSAALWFVLPHFAAGQHASASIVGRVTDEQSHAPIPRAQIVLIGTSRTAASDEDGRFRADSLRAGDYVVRARAPGYAARSWIVQVGEGEVRTQAFELEPLPTELEPVQVQRTLSLGEEQRLGFERRRAAGRGYFISEDAIKRADLASLGDVLRNVPGVRLLCRGASSCTVRMARAPVACKPDFVVDGFPASGSTSLAMSVAGITGVEIYRTLSETPLEFLKGDNTCGTVVIWTRSGR